MDSLYDRMTEDSVSELAKAGCLVDVTITGYGTDARFRVKISKGSAKHGGPGLEIVAEGEGSNGAAALRGAVATAETFLSMVSPRHPLPILPEMAATPKSPVDPAVADILAGRAPRPVHLTPEELVQEAADEEVAF